MSLIETLWAAGIRNPSHKRSSAPGDCFRQASFQEATSNKGDWLALNSAAQDNVHAIALLPRRATHNRDRSGSRGSVEAWYYSRMANLPVLVQNEPPPGMPPFKVFIVRNGDCLPGEIERYVSESAQLGVGPSRFCIPRHF